MADNESPSIKKIANPAGLGLLAFGMTTVLLNIHNLGLFAADATILAMGIFYGGIAQVIAGIFEFKAGNTFGATAFTSYGLFWLTFVFISLPVFNGGDGMAIAAVPVSLAAYFAIWGVLTAFLFIGTLKGVRTLQIVFATLAILFFLVAISKGIGSVEVGYVAGAVGVFCGGTAIYTALGEVLNEQHGRTILPLG